LEGLPCGAFAWFPLRFIQASAFPHVTRMPRSELRGPIFMSGGIGG